jgi:hypothetical protein
VSLPQFQTALATLIRLPDHNRSEDLEGFLKQYDLTSNERDQLRILSSDHNVAKYGHSMSNVRWEQVLRDLPFSRAVFPPTLLEEIRRVHFDPFAVSLRSGDLALAFFDFVLSDKSVNHLLSDMPFLRDVLRFEESQARVKRLMRAPKAPDDGSFLVHSAFRVVSVDHDLLTFFNALSRATLEKIRFPAHREMNVLILPKEGGGVRYFEVGSEITSFLRGSLRVGGKGRLPAAYEDLVQLGLCRPLH